MTISVVRDNHQGKCENGTNIHFNCGKEDHFARKCVSKRGEDSGQLRKWNLKKTFVSRKQKLWIRIKALET